MNARRLVAVLLCAGGLLPVHATAQEKTDPKQPVGIDKATIEAWEKHGFKLESPTPWPGWVKGSQLTSNITMLC